MILNIYQSKLDYTINKRRGDEFVEEELTVTRITATRYLNLLVESGFLKKQKIGKSNFYINEPLFELFKTNNKLNQRTDIIKTINPGHV